MKIELTKQEWEFLKECLYSEFNIPLVDNNWTKTEKLYDKILQKLGSKWKDDE